LPPISLDGVHALIATSRNALRGLRRNAAFGEARRLPVYTVGQATAAYAADLGFFDIRLGAGTGRDLAALIARTARPGAGTMLYLTGEHIAFDLAGALAPEGYDISRSVVYAALENPAAGADFARHLQAGIDGAILMSPRAAQIFATLLAGAPAGDIRGMTCYCYSQGVVKPLAHIEGLRLSVAARPTEADLLALIGTVALPGSVSRPSDELLGKS
jgi:uroporphyrinogen-III synthase